MVFSGIVEGRGIIKQITPRGAQSGAEGITLTIEPQNSSFMNADIALGCSIAVNGTCLTVTEFNKAWFKVDLAPETIRKTSFSDYKEGALVNLERALKATDRNSGHTVQGHVDGTGKIVSLRQDGLSLTARISTKGLSEDRKTRKAMNALIVPKGFIAVDGASLTVCEVNLKEEWFSLMLIPHTQEVLKPWKEGARVNLELDCMAKYVAATVESFVDPVVHKLKKRLRRTETISIASGAVAAVCVLLLLFRRKRV